MDIELENLKKFKKAKYDKEYRKKNLEKLNQKRKLYRSRDDIKNKKAEYDKNYRENNINTINEKRKIYYENNSEKLKAYGRTYHQKNREVLNKKSKEYWEKNRDILKERIRSRSRNEEKRKWSKKRYATDPIFKYICSLRTRLGRAFKSQNIKKSKHTKDLVGCAPEFLKEHLAAQFKEGMTHENHGSKGWHIDHIIPLASAGTDIEKAEKLCHYTNLQPLWWWENLQKSAKYDTIEADENS
jgi:hypothetical protein